MQTTPNVIQKVTTVAGVAAAITGGVLVGRWLWGVLGTAGETARRGAPLSADEALVAVAAGVGLAVVAWLTLGVVLEAAARVPGQVGRVAAHASAAVSPVVVRRAVGVLLGATLGAALTPGVSMASTGSALGTAIGVSASPSPGPASGGSVPDAAAPHPAFAPLPDPGFGPTDDLRSPPDVGDERFVAQPPVVRPQPDVSAVAAADRRAASNLKDAGHEVVVHRGDSLWSIAARHLGRDPSDAEIASEWPRWYDANRSVIGTDPDRLLPGQVLLAPSGVRP